MTQAPKLIPEAHYQKKAMPFAALGALEMKQMSSSNLGDKISLSKDLEDVSQSAVEGVKRDTTQQPWHTITFRNMPSHKGLAPSQSIDGEVKEEKLGVTKSSIYYLEEEAGADDDDENDLDDDVAETESFKSEMKKNTHVDNLPTSYDKQVTICKQV